MYDWERWMNHNNGSWWDSRNLTPEVMAGMNLAHAVGHDGLVHLVNGVGRHLQLCAQSPINSVLHIPSRRLTKAPVICLNCLAIAP